MKILTMKLLSLKIVFISVFFSTSCLASQDTVYFWNNVSFETDQGKVYLRVDQKTGALSEMRVFIDDKEVSVDNKYFLGLSSIQLNTVKYSGGCSFRPVKCYKYLSFEYRVDVDFEVYPDWYEDPQVTFIFSEGQFVERRQRIKKSPKLWELISTDLKGVVHVGKEEIVRSY
ncbi:hypothetical protein FLL45_13635 [Aliikangiella marina]|uniref:Lipoprotein n=1 Tax=Aliikangiella marina TaxID=1712262 RepID=A0A545T9K3_9GAMM|nr:hypothetical protein [Aliikangiella marina]TQV73901.1 hypothetical protein FLL45_13635 [Aliikangiella marina]